MRRAEKASVRIVVAAAVLVLSTQAAQAQPAGRYQRSWVPPSSESAYVVEEPPAYTMEIVAADAVSLGLMFAGARSEGPNGEDGGATGALFLGGISAHLAGGPIIHAVHGQGRRAALSFAMRALIPTTLGLMSISANDGCGDGLFCELDDFGYYFVGGMVVASVIDWAVLSHGSTLAKRRLRSPSVPMWSPTVSPAVGGAQLGVVGTF